MILMTGGSEQPLPITSGVTTCLVPRLQPWRGTREQRAAVIHLYLQEDHHSTGSLSHEGFRSLGSPGDSHGHIEGWCVASRHVMWRNWMSCLVLLVAAVRFMNPAWCMLAHPQWVGWVGDFVSWVLWQLKGSGRHWTDDWWPTDMMLLSSTSIMVDAVCWLDCASTWLLNKGLC